jgi:hypothetical protein
MRDILDDQFQQRGLGLANSKPEARAVLLHPFYKKDTRFFKDEIDRELHIENLRRDLKETYGEASEPPAKRPRVEPPKLLGPGAFMSLSNMSTIASLTSAASAAAATAGSADEWDKYLEMDLDLSKLEASTSLASFPVLDFWRDLKQDQTSAAGVTVPAQCPRLAEEGLKHMIMCGTSCQSERDFSALTDLMRPLRQSMNTVTVSRVQSIRLNKKLLSKQFRAVLAEKEARKQQRNLNKKALQKPAPAAAQPAKSSTAGSEGSSKDPVAIE